MTESANTANANRLASFQAYLLIALAISITWALLWSQGQSLDILTAKPLPNWRDGDMPYVFAWIKSFTDYSSSYVTLSFNQYLNAPYIANWNDFPGEDLSFVIPGLLAKAFGLFLGANLYILLIHVLSGLSFFYVSNKLGYERCWGMMCAILFAFTPVIFYRGLGHISVASVWYLPFILFSIIWVYSPEKIMLDSKKAWWLCALTCVLSGLFNIYYAALFTFFLGINWLIRIIKGDRHSQTIALLLWLILLAEILCHLNFIRFMWLEDSNPLAMMRSLQSLLFTSLTLPDLLFTPSHQGFYFDNLLPFAKNYYKNIPSNFASENQLSYIGLTAVVGLLILLAQTIRHIYEKQFSQISNWFWPALGVFTFSITGGVNYLLGSIGFLLLRSNSRYSIFLMLIGLYFICELLTQKNIQKNKWVIAIALTVFGVWDQVPSKISIFPYIQQGNIQAPQLFKSFTETLEQALPKGAMVFQLPVHAFPESGMQEEMGDYEQFMPYLFSKQLHFSFGSIKGRADTIWQRELVKLSLSEQLKQLESYGFSALLVHKNAYPHHGDELIQKIKKLGYQVIEENTSLVAFRLKPASQPKSPAPKWELVRSTALTKPVATLSEVSSWSKVQSGAIEIKEPWYLRLDLQRRERTSNPLHLGFFASQQCTITLSLNHQTQKEVALTGKSITQLTLNPSLLETNLLSYKTDCPVMILEKGTNKGNDKNEADEKSENVYFKLIQYIE